MKKFFFTLVLLMSSAALFAQKNGPFSYPYYIKGQTTIDANDGHIELQIDETKGFSFSRVVSGNQRNERASFTFEEIKTSPSISISGKKLQYWRQNTFGEWIPDSESGSGTVNDKLEKDIAIMMVLDCSTSMGKDFSRLQQSANSFIKSLFGASSDGHIHLGIIGVSSISECERQTYEIRPLDNTTAAESIRFVNSLKQEDNTALYYAVDKATGMLSDYVSAHLRNISRSDYEGTYMLVFTDGLDNASQFRSEKIFKSEDAYNYAKNKLKNTRVMGEHIRPYIIGARGSDLTTTNQINDFRTKMESMVPDQYGQFLYLENMSSLESAFSEITETLTKRWQNLVCFTSVAHEGGVCWTLGEVAPVVNVVPVYRLFLGVNVGGGGLQYYDFDYQYDDALLFSAGIDFAYPLSRKFSLGGYVSLGFSEGVGGVGNIGLLSVIGDYHNKKGAFIVGVGAGYCWDEFSLGGRIGYQFKNGLYVTGNVYSQPSLSLSIGYNWGRFMKVKKNK